MSHLRRSVPEVFTTVAHDVTPASAFTNTVQVNQQTANGDGSVHFVVVTETNGAGEPEVEHLVGFVGGRP